MFIQAIIFKLEDIITGFSYDPAILMDILLKKGVLIDLPMECVDNFIRFENCLDKYLNNHQKSQVLKILEDIDIDNLKIKKILKERILSFKGKGARVFFISLFPKRLCINILKKENIFQIVDGYVCGEQSFKDCKRLDYLIKKYGVLPEKTIYVTFSKKYKNFKGFIISPDGFIEAGEIEKELY